MLLDVFWSAVQVKGLGSGLESLMHLISGAGCFEGARLLGTQPGVDELTESVCGEDIRGNGDRSDTSFGRSNIHCFCPPSSGPPACPNSSNISASVRKVPGLGGEIRQQVPRGPG